MSTERLVAGCMTGTSIDSLDAALVRVRGEGLAMSVEFVRGVTRPLADMASTLRRLADQEPMTAGEIARVSWDFAVLHAEVLQELIAGTGPPTLVGVHGQTVFHAPPLSWQLLSAAPIARALGAPVVFDLRAADLAAGGQGAPITPIADWVMLRSGDELRAVVNLGGFCNATVLTGEGPGAVTGLDVCPCNHLLDTIARKLFHQPYDKGGARAAGGSVHDRALEDLDGALRSRRRPGRSMGTGDECAEWVSRWRAHISGDDLAATACEVIAQHIAAAVSGADRVLLAGGGVRNRALVRAIGSCCSARVEPTDAYGLPAEYREAACMAVLGALCQDRVPITVPRVTGVPAPAPLAGTWMYP